MTGLEGKTVIVVAGGTREYIDDVRVLTNISSGKLGAIIADELVRYGAHVIYIAAKGSDFPRYTDSPNMKISIIYTVADLIEKFKHIAGLYNRTPESSVDAVIMAVAASDFTFKRDGSVKLKSNDPEAFIEYMRKTITTNPKVITKIKKWFPETYLVGFKFEVGQEHEKLIQIARESMKKSKADLVIANDKAEMAREGEHTGYLVNSLTEERCANKYDITAKLVDRLKNIFNKE